jgi:DNA polymerase I-like protein with 3'-5' exonuclease and polymerase domains
MKIIHNAAFDVPFIRLQTGIHIRNVFDTMLAEKLLIAGRMGISASLKDTLTRHELANLNKDVEHNAPITKEYIEYAKNDVKYLHKLALLQYSSLKQLEMLEVLDLEMRCVEATSEMRYNGFQFDTERWLEIANANEAVYNKQLKKLGNTINWNSPKQVKEEFKHLGLKSFEELPDMKGKDKRLDQFILMREYYKSVTSYGKSWLWRDKHETESTVDSDGRVRCNFNQIIDTGRYSSSNPNMQQLPATGDHREAFIAAKGYTLCVADFSGQELGIMAAGSNEPSWIKVMESGGDLHSHMAKLIFGEDFKPELRRLAKDLNFGLAYGQGVKAFAEKSNLPLSKAESIVRKYKLSVPKLTRWLEKNGAIGIREGKISSFAPYNRLRILDGEDWQKRNKAKNTPIQGTAADMLKLSLVRLYEHIYEHKLPVKIVTCIHDEIITEVKNNYAKQWVTVKQNIMNKAAFDILKYNLVRTTPKLVKTWKEAK